MKFLNRLSRIESKLKRLPKSRKATQPVVSFADESDARWFVDQFAQLGDGDPVLAYQLFLELLLDVEDGGAFPVEPMLPVEASEPGRIKFLKFSDEARAEVSRFLCEIRTLIQARDTALIDRVPDDSDCLKLE